ncbi:MAG: OadG family protein [Gammaproteobacteria bacterium]|nr:OadG family protein [Gammaproteobacteria bacterium]MBU2059855.1 OadG family protein [Gammaproteobacteria bacterium]MBU2175364.1 OadG family protein [Gammaproteobacteria bacterium]MBU2245728.1 OadG family protein [Gammaproteobacteria bacterium]MBU2345132.1 OadG family protein [Gammaproteobacteria bacterium]
MGAEQQVSVLLLDAAVLMVVGMGVVFSFLMILVFAVQGMSRLLRHSSPALPAAVATTQQATVSPSVVAAISAAIEHHQKQNKG